MVALQALGYDAYLADVEAGSRRAALAPHAVVGAISRQLRRSFAERRMLAAFGCEPDVTGEAFGDSVVVAVTLPLAQAHRQASLLSLLARAAAYAQRLAAVAPHPLAYRGALATGRFEITAGPGSRRRFDGAPAREAGRLFNRAVGALVFLAPSALDTRLGTALPDGWDELAQPVGLPVEDGRATLETLALDPCFGLPPAERAPVHAGLLGALAGEAAAETEAFLNRLDVVRTNRLRATAPAANVPGPRIPAGFLQA